MTNNLLLDPFTQQSESGNCYLNIVKKWLWKILCICFSLYHENESWTLHEKNVEVSHIKALRYECFAISAGLTHCQHFLMLWWIKINMYLSLVYCVLFSVLQFYPEMETLIRKKVCKEQAWLEITCCWLNNVSDCHSNSFVVTQDLWIFTGVVLDGRNSKHCFQRTAEVLGLLYWEQMFAVLTKHLLCKGKLMGLFCFTRTEYQCCHLWWCGYSTNISWIIFYLGRNNAKLSSRTSLCLNYI